MIVSNYVNNMLFLILIVMAKESGLLENNEMENICLFFVLYIWNALLKGNLYKLVGSQSGESIKHWVLLYFMHSPIFQ